MPAAVRAYVTAGVALVGASVISVTPVVPNLAAAQQEVRTVSMDVNLSAQSVANIGPNLINMFLNMPQAHVNAVNYFAESWSLSGNWWVYSQDNILGWDRRNPAMAWSFVDLLLPIPALSKPYGEATQWWMAANLPQHKGCSGLPPCPEYNDMFNSMFKVPGWEFYDEDGYTFGEDGYTPQYDQVSENEHYWGYELGEEGDQIAWYGQTVKLDPFASLKSLINYLMEDPEPLTFPTWDETVTAYQRFGEAINIMFNPFVPQSYIWNPRYSLSAYLFRPFAKVLCPSCNKYDPFMPPDWVPEDGFPIPVDDGWQDDDAQTPTGQPLPTESTPNVSLLAGAEKTADADDADSTLDLSESLEKVQETTTDLLENPLGAQPEEETEAADETVPETEEVPSAEPEEGAETTPPAAEVPAAEEPAAEEPAAEVISETPAPTQRKKKTFSLSETVKSVQDKFSRSEESTEAKDTEKKSDDSQSDNEKKSDSDASDKGSSDKDSE